MADTSKIRVLKTRREHWHQDVLTELKECFAEVKTNPNISTVIICTEDQAGEIRMRWSGCEDRAKFGSRLILAGMRRMGLKT